MDLTKKKTAGSFQKGKKGLSPKGKSMKKKANKRFARKESKVDKEIKEIEKLNAILADLASSSEEEKTVMKKFEELPISQYTKTGLKEAGFVEMTEIQQSSILQSLEGHDTLGCAKTGSGKTLAFLIPALECLYRDRWDTDDGVGVLIVSPIRELAIQIFDVLCTIGKYHSFSAGLVIGGKDFEDEQKRIISMNILVATPGRLLQHIEQTPGFDCSNVKCLVIDEVDRCLDMGFRKVLDQIVDSLGTERQSLMFSATVDENVKKLSSHILHEPLYINVTPDEDYVTPKTIMQRYVVCELGQKIELLYSFLKSHLKSKSLVFANSRKEVRFLFETFRRMKPGVSLMHIHGKQKQTMRTYTYYDYLQKDQACMLSTDVAARGLDFPNIDWVIQFDAPEDSASYIHRVGRAGRFRSKGNALTFILPSEEERFLNMMVEARIPVKRISVNPSRTESVTRRVMQEVAKDTELNVLAVGAFRSYVRSVALAGHDVNELPLESFAESLGLGVVPKVKLNKVSV